jgi:hypothetical protein
MNSVSSRTTINENGCGMNLWKAPAPILLIVVMSLSTLVSLSGCSGGTKTASPQQKEEQRQKMIKNADRERREG